MNFAGRFIDLLGQQMYGGPVPSVAELIANAWDADAGKVEISIPENLTKEDAEIVVRDFGKGMSFEEINQCYLYIGYERRQRGERTPGGRLVMGRKGIGKLAGFGIAEDVIIRSVQDGCVVQFDLNYTELKSRESLQGYEFTPTVDEKTDESNGVTVTYKHLKAKQNINIEAFRRSMGRRFALETGKMQIIINGTELTHEDLGFEWRTPTDGWQEEDVPGFGKVSYWFGFLKNTVQDPELRGVSVFARNRIAQVTPFFFNLTGGINGQVGLEYLTGQIKSDELDASIDYIATDRQTVNWQFGNAPALEKWGQEKIKELCKDWKKRREEEKGKKFAHDYSELAPLINPLPEQERKDLREALGRIARIESISADDFMVIAHSVVSGVQRESVKKVIQRINAANDDAVDDLFQAIKEWDVISAVAVAEIVRGKIEIIRQFENHLNNRTPEKSAKGLPDMQDFIKEHPWLLGHEYEQLSSKDIYHERGVDSWIRDVLTETDKEYSAKNSDGKRFDLLCIKDRREIVILELMRPGVPADFDHATRLERYVTKVESAIDKRGTGDEFAKMMVTGKLIADNFTDDSSLKKVLARLRSTGITAVEWRTLFDQVEGRYKDYFEILKEKAPNDPRIKGLDDLDRVNI